MNELHSIRHLMRDDRWFIRPTSTNSNRFDGQYLFNFMNYFHTEESKFYERNNIFFFFFILTFRYYSWGRIHFDLMTSEHWPIILWFLSIEDKKIVKYVIGQCSVEHAISTTSLFISLKSSIRWSIQFLMKISLADTFWKYSHESFFLFKFKLLFVMWSQLFIFNSTESI